MADDEKSPLLKNVVVQKTKKDLKKKLLPGDKLSKKQRKKLVDQFYEDQKKLLCNYEDDEKRLKEENRKQFVDENAVAQNAKTKWDKILASIVFCVNLVMLLANLSASILSGSYSVLSAFIDSSMDILASVIVFISLWAIQNTNFFNYPRGRERLELLAVIMCSVVMGVANVMMIILSVQSIVTDTVDPEVTIPTIALIWSGIALKIVMVFVCYRHGTPSSKVLAMDQRNDLITNLTAFFGAFIGDRYWKYADPAGAIIVCFFIAMSWFSNAFQQIPLIAGFRAKRVHLSRILHIAINHDPRIKFMDHLMVYHVGEKELVELHIVLDESLPLRETHDIAESLEQKIKALDFVERAFVHVDYKIDGIDDGT